ncbi:MAG: tetratricopeptide repeat protein [Alphaproteobacteria bacterium]|nr:tetratricopeptide repeat protein [Alphaproteobacteria bacterium]
MTAALLEQAVAAHQDGLLAKAEELYRTVLTGNPEHPDALALLGVVLDSQGRAQEALPLIEKALRLDPGAELFRFYYGNALMTAGDLPGAIAAYRGALALNPSMPQAFYNLGNALRQNGDWEEAGKVYAKTLQLAPHHIEARNNLALVLEHKGLLEDALRLLQQVVREAPSYGEGWLNLCNIAEKHGDYEASYQAGLRAAALLPEKAAAYLGLGVALNHMERHEEALGAYQTALRLKPGWTEVWDNIGQTYQFMNRLDEAEAAYRKTIALSGQDIAGEDSRLVGEREYGNRHWHLALLELLKGDYRRGFARYRARFEEVGGLKRPVWPQPVWRGEDISGKTILVMDEQGLGDCLMMARYVPLLKARGARVKFLVHPVLAPLFEGWPGADEVIAQDPPVSGFDCYASIFDLPFGFGTALETVPADIPYLPLPQPDASLMLEDDERPKIAVVWAGTPKHKHDARRSVPLETFARLFDEPAVRFFSLNRDNRPGDDALLRKLPVTDLSSQLNTLRDTAHLMAGMDLIITCDTATAHLAGGMGKDVWTLLPFAPDWRWLIGRDDSPWYPSMRLFRQTQSGDWNGVIDRVRQSMHQWLTKKRKTKQD